MMLAFAELRRTPRRFLSIAGAVGFIVFLALILSALSDGLYLGSTGAYRTSDADFFVFAEDAEFQLDGSVLPVSLVDDVQTVEGVIGAGGLASFTTTAVSGSGEDLQLSLLGAGPTTYPSDIVDGRLPAAGAPEVVVDAQLERRDVGIGSTISVTDGPDLEVVGVAADAGFGFATAWTSLESFHAVRSAVRPELASEAGTVQAIGVDAADDSGAVEEAVAGLDGVAVASIQDAIDALPAASQQRTTLNGITNTTFVVAAIVIGLFFALITLEKRTQFAVLKAVGMSNRTLLFGIFAQSLVASAVGYAIGLGLARLAGFVIPDDVPALFVGGTALFVFVATLVTGALGAVFSFRRIIRIDPATALGGA